MSTTRDWDAATYDRVSGPQQAWAREQFNRLELAGDEVILDAGCGSGRVTAALCQRVPKGRVYAVDAAPSMVQAARELLGESAQVLCQDLAALELPEPVDVVFSNATFHWISDHDALFAALRRSLKSGGRLVAQCGGEGNIAGFRRLADAVAAHEPYAPFLSGWGGPWNFAEPGGTAARLERAGFSGVRAWLQPKPTRPADPRGFVASSVLVAHLQRLPAELRERYLDEVMAGTETPVTLDYVRLNLTATAA